MSGNLLPDSTDDAGGFVRLGVYVTVGAKQLSRSQWFRQELYVCMAKPGGPCIVDAGHHIVKQVFTCKNSGHGDLLCNKVRR